MMSRLKTALIIGATLLVAGVGHAQAANNHSSIWKFGLIDGLGVPLDLVDLDIRKPAIDLSGDQDGKGPPKKPSGPNWKTQYEENLTNGDNWSSNQADAPDGNGWQQNTDSQTPKQWTTQEVARP